jgi:hypothetical protein
MDSIFVLDTLVSHSWICDLSSKNHSHPALIGRDFHHLVQSDNLNGRRADWMYLL